MSSQLCSLDDAKLNHRPYRFGVNDIVTAARDYLSNPNTVAYIQGELWGSLQNQAEEEILTTLARRQPQTAIELIPESLPKPEQSGRSRALTSLGERWLIKSDVNGYFIPYDCFRRWIRQNYFEGL